MHFDLREQEFSRQYERVVLRVANGSQGCKQFRNHVVLPKLWWGYQHRTEAQFTD